VGQRRLVRPARTVNATPTTEEKEAGNVSARIKHTRYFPTATRPQKPHCTLATASFEAHTPTPSINWTWKPENTSPAPVTIYKAKRTLKGDRIVTRLKPIKRISFVKDK